MGRILPTTSNRKKIETELRFVRSADRNDAIQEAWVAHLEGRNPARAVATYAQRIRRERTRTQTSSRLLAVLGC